MALRERDRPEEAEELLDEALRGSPPSRATRETDELDPRRTQACVLADRGETEAALAMARRNCELTEQLGDVFSRSSALTTLAYVADRRRRAR